MIHQELRKGRNEVILKSFLSASLAICVKWPVF